MPLSKADFAAAGLFGGVSRLLKIKIRRAVDVSTD
jgi:hypothetical protein